MSSPIAHASVAIIGKSIYRKAPLWLFLLATQVPDLLFFLFEILGIEDQADVNIDLVNGYNYLSPASIPWSHGLFMCFVWSVVLAAGVFLFYRRFSVSIAAGLMVMSHWLMDFIVYDNLPLFLKGSPEVGFGLVKSPVGVKFGIAIEVVGVIGILLYVTTYIVKKIRAKRALKN